MMPDWLRQRRMKTVGSAIITAVMLLLLTFFLFPTRWSALVINLGTGRLVEETEMVTLSPIWGSDAYSITLSPRLEDYAKEAKEFGPYALGYGDAFAPTFAWDWWFWIDLCPSVIVGLIAFYLFRLRLRRRMLHVLLAVAVVAALYPLQASIESTRARHDLAAARPAAELPSGEFLGTVLLGGFRAIAVDLIWVKAQEAEKSRDWHRLLLLNEAIASVQPRFIEVWMFNMWNMAYNLSLTAVTDHEAWQWVKKGIEFGKEGYRRNPDSWKLAWSVGYQYYHKCGTEGSDRAHNFQAALLKETGKTNLQHALSWFETANKVAVDPNSFVIHVPGEGPPEWDRNTALIRERLDKMEASYRFDGEKFLLPVRKTDLEPVTEALADLGTAPTTFYTGNPHWLAMVATAHRQMALDAEEKDDLAAMVEARHAAIEWLGKLMQGYPENESFTRYARDEINDLSRRLRAHDMEHAAREHQGRGETTAEFEQLLGAADFWMKAYHGNAYVNEQARHLERIAGRFEELMQAGDEDVRRRAEQARFDIWIELLVRPEIFDTTIDRIERYTTKCQKLDEGYSARLKAAIEAGDYAAAMPLLVNSVRLRQALFKKYRTDQPQAEALRAVAGTCESLWDKVPEAERPQLDAMTRAAWLNLIENGRVDGIDAGIARLKAWTDAAMGEAGSKTDRDSEALRQEAVEVLSTMFQRKIEAAWAEQHLRAAGSYYTDAIARALEANDLQAAIDFHRRSKAIWSRIWKAGDEQAEANLNRADELYRMILQRGTSE